MNKAIEGLVGLVGGIAIAVTPVTIDRELVKLGFPASVSAFEENANGFNHLIPTNLNDLTPIEKGYADLSKKIQGNESYIERFLLPNGRRISRVSINGRAYAYSFREPDGTVYGIVDVDGNGIFTRKYDKSERWDIPEWAAKLVY